MNRKMKIAAQKKARRMISERKERRRETSKSSSSCAVCGDEAPTALALAVVPICGPSEEGGTLQ